MWTRKELKDKAKVSFKANYWKSVLVALVLMVVVGGMSYYSAAQSVPASSSTPEVESTMYSSDDVNVSIKDGKIHVDATGEDGDKVHLDMDGDDLQDLRDYGIEVNDDEVTIQPTPLTGPGMVLLGLSVFLAGLIVTAVVVALYVFIFSPLEVGAQRFFIRNLNQRAEVKEVAFGYDNNYMQNVKTLFLRDLFIILWSLLFIIPGIYKSYEYRMIPYLLADDPTMTKDRAFAESKRMMDGQKWKTFVLDLSFLGWDILSALTLGILGVFYVTPYQSQTNAALYEKLRYGLPAPEPVAQAAPVAPMYAAPAQASAQAPASPVIVPAAQPPVPPFAQAGVQPEVEVGENDTAPDSPEA